MTSTSKNRRPFIIALVSAVVIALVISGSLFYLGRKIESSHSKIDRLRSSIFHEVETHYSALQNLYSSTTLMAEDVQRLQRTLNISPGSYGLEENIFEEEEETDTEDSQDGNVSFFKALDRLISEDEINSVQQSVAGLFEESGDLSSFLEERNLALEKTDTLTWELAPKAEGGDGEQLLGSTCKVEAQKKSSREYVLALSPPHGHGNREGIELPLSRNSYSLSSDGREELKSFIAKNRHNLQEHLQRIEERVREVEELVSSPPVEEVCAEKQLSPGEAENTASTVEWTPSGSGFEDSVSFGIEKEQGNFFIVAGEEKNGEKMRFDALDTFSEALRETLSSVDTRTKTEKAVDRSIERIRHMAEDEAFKDYLSQKDLELDDEPREGADHIYFDLLSKDTPSGNSDEGIKGAFAVHKKEGTIYIVDSDEVIISSLRNIDRGEAFHSTGSPSGARLPDNFSSWSGVSSEDQHDKVILLCGIHENNADTIMLARLSGENIALLSVPRDIYYQERKLASYYRVYGPEELRRVISEITGVRIDGYISVDMYAFIEVVDILGGIEVTLEEALVDPTYRIKEDGKWSTLHYSEGSHKLNGIEALRVARSRHTSDDFDRGKRQHLILAALKEKLNSLHAGDISKLKDIFEALLNYIHTNYSLMEAVQLFSSYHDVPIASLEGLSSENVLYVTYSNLHRLGKEMDEVDEDFPKGAWILLPEEDDWRAIEWFVQRSFGMSEKTKERSTEEQKQ